MADLTTVVALTTEVRALALAAAVLARAFALVRTGVRLVAHLAAVPTGALPLGLASLLERVKLLAVIVLALLLWLAPALLGLIVPLGEG